MKAPVKEPSIKGVRQPLNQSRHNTPSAPGGSCDGLCGKLVEIPAAYRAAQPIESVADGGLARFVAEVARQDAPLDHARHARHVAIFDGVEHVATARAQHHDQHARLGGPRARHAGVGVDDRGADRNARAAVPTARHRVAQAARRTGPARATGRASSR